MKKCRKLFRNLLWVAVLCGGAMFTACSDDDDPQPGPGPEPVTPVIILAQGDQITFTNEIREITVDSIMTNVDTVRVKSAPAWATVDLAKVSDSYYKAVVKMAADDLDSDKREGEILFWDGRENGTQAKLKVTCLAAGEILVEKAAFAEAFPGTEGSASFTVYGLEDGYEFVCYKKTVDRELGVVYTKIEEDAWFTVEAAGAAQNAALTAKVYEVKWEAYNAADGKKERMASVFVVPADDAADFDPLASTEGVQEIEITQTNAYIPPVKINLDSTSYVQSGVELEFTVTLAAGYTDVELYPWLMDIEPENVDEPLFSMGDPDSYNRAQWVTITRIDREGQTFTYKITCPAMTAADANRGADYRSCTLYALPKTADGAYATEEVYVDLGFWQGYEDHVLYDGVGLYQYLDKKD